LVAGVLVAAPLSAQSRDVSLEGRAGAAIPVGNLSDGGAESGLMAEGELIFTPALNLSVFAGLGMHAFNCEGDDDECEEFSSRGLHGGLKYLFGQSGTATPWLRGGLMLHEAEFGETDSDFSLGFEAGGGIDLALSPQFSLTPALRYHQYEADFDASSVDMSWVSLALGAHLHF
jgi:opacity protein-like surface antigen